MLPSARGVRQVVGCRVQRYGILQRTTQQRPAARVVRAVAVAAEAATLAGGGDGMVAVVAAAERIDDAGHLRGRQHQTSPHDEVPL